MQRECQNFVPNLWKPLLCSNCLQAHPSSSAPPSPAVGRVGKFISLTSSRLESAPLLSSSSPSPSTPLSQPIRGRALEHKRSNSTPGTSTIKTNLTSSINTGPLPRRTNINVLTHSESAKRKKDDSSSGVCDSFIPQRWRTSVCMHCFESIHLHNAPHTREASYVNMDISGPPSPQDDDGNGKDETLLASSIPLPQTPRAPQDVEETLAKLSSSLRFSQEKKILSTPTSTSSSTTTTLTISTHHHPLASPISIPTNNNRSNSTTPKSSTTPRTSLTPRTPKSPPVGAFLTLNRSLDDDDDPFADFEELYDTASFELRTSTSFSSNQQGTTTTLRTSLRSSRSAREQALNKYKESDEDWEGGVDMDVETFVANQEYSYFNNKIMEIASVKKEAERSQAEMQENPNVVMALYEILAAKQKQIQKALDREKINEQDHNKLLERLNAVKELLPNHGW